MRAKEFISEQTAKSVPPTDPQEYLKWWYTNAPKGHGGVPEPKGSWWDKSKQNYNRWEPLYKEKWGPMFGILRTIEIAVPVMIYHDSLVQINELLKKSPEEGGITPEQAVGMRNNVAGWLITSIVLPRLTAALVKGVGTAFVGGILETALAAGGKSGAKAKLIISAIGAGAYVVTSLVLSTQEGRDFLRNWGADYVVYGIGTPTNKLIDWLWSFLPESWQKKLDTAIGTPELNTAVKQVNQADDDLEKAASSWEDNFAADRASKLDALRRNAR
jgi:hypothetical protein